MVLAKWESEYVWKGGTSENKSGEENKPLNIGKTRKSNYLDTVGLILRNLSSKKGSDENRSEMRSEKRKNNKIALIGCRTRNLAGRNGFGEVRTRMWLGKRARRINIDKNEKIALIRFRIKLFRRSSFRNVVEKKGQTDKYRKNKKIVLARRCARNLIRTERFSKFDPGMWSGKRASYINLSIALFSAKCTNYSNITMQNISDKM